MLHQSARFSRKLHKYLNQKNAVTPVQYMVLIGVAICINFLYFLKCQMAGGEFPPPGSRVIWYFLGKKNRRQDFLAAVTVCLWSYVGVSNW